MHNKNMRQHFQNTPAREKRYTMRFGKIFLGFLVSSLGIAEVKALIVVERIETGVTLL